VLGNLGGLKTIDRFRGVAYTFWRDELGHDERGRSDPGRDACARETID